MLFGAIMGASGVAAEEFHHDFRKGMPNRSMLILVGPNAQKAAKQGPDGLHINMEDGRKAMASVGISPRFGLRGDFEILFTYELLNVASTEPGFGAGINLWVGTASSQEDEASLGRFSRDNKSLHVVTKSAKDSEGKMRTKSLTFPAEVKKGKLRLERTGATLRYSVCEGDDSDFVEVYKTEFVRDDVRSVRIAGNTGRLPLALSFRITEVTIRGEQFIDPDLAKAEASWWKWVAVNGAGLALLLGIGLWFYRRRRKASARTLADSPKTPDGASPNAV